MLGFFWQRCDASTLPADALEWLGNAAGTVESMALSLGDTLTGLANLLDTSENGARALSDDNLPQTLWGAADTLRTIGALAFIAGEAEYELRQRATAGAHSRARRTQPSEREACGA
ncbi:hypothetical protein DF021_13320 [Burkholderia stagnalis]|uniref:Uncharacterized protein n=1 Tax=Burkholderia stagnalis TaxID=1503054 RepID=A0ABX9YNL9_9BURK|nr:hypothetical protein DF158_12580 [Burkholderia stagnalis]RQQ66145.1 hypothetical protein DF137_21535 [Burkholderia stagnalis]RQQ67913.1 hypothetical protein DF139_19435 [Burkholderia stagnalis]RQQ78742.1 hypothetical protein DF138_19875 [Burkholderia stagnalis]RQQ88244.1 hypothetical protein DF136_20000 [Burkholderia stagnalis]